MKEERAARLLIVNVFLRYIACVPFGIIVASSPSLYPKPEEPEDQFESLKLNEFQLELGSEVGIMY